MAEEKKMKSEAAASSSSSGESVVVDVGRRKSSCGYCKSGALTSISHGLWAHSLTVDDYQALLDRGWRRSGCFLYKPDMEKTCCPSYTIRLKTSDFVPSKEQSRVSKRVQRFIDGTLDVKKSDDLIHEPNTRGDSRSNIAHNQDTSTFAVEASGEGNDKADQFLHFLSEQIDNIVQLCVKNGEFPSNIQMPKASVKKVTSAKRKLHAEKSENLIFSCNIAFQIASTLRRLKKDIDNVESSLNCIRGRNSAELSPNMIAEILASNSKQLAESSGFSVKACNGHINFYSSLQQADFVHVGRDAVSKSSLTASTSDISYLKKSSEGHGAKKRRFEIRLKRSSFDHEEYTLYRKYQLTVHNDAPDRVTESSYKRFLVDTPLLYLPPKDDGTVPPCGFGSFHQQYVVDGKLIAVGVIDILPKCLSSKYLFWDPDFAFLSLGKYSALQEIRWISENQVHCSSLQYYYLGYYIHSCHKMRYKASYRPSELLCPLRYQWVPYDIAKPLLDKRKYVVLSDFATLQDGESLLRDLDDHMEDQQNGIIQEASNDAFVNEDEMAELDSEDSDDGSDLEASGATPGLEDVDLGDILIGIEGARLRYKDLRHAFESGPRKFLEKQLQRYVRVVGTELSEQMVYSLG